MITIRILFIGLWTLFAAFTSQGQAKIVFFGNSLTAGYGVESNQAFPAIIDNKIKEAGLKYQVVNAGLSGETTAGGVHRVDWILKNHEIDLFVLELGANDGLRGLKLEQTKKNLQTIISKVKNSEPGVDILLAGMQVPPNMGPTYSEQFKQIFNELAQSDDKVHLIPFLLEGVGGDRSLNLADGIHPNPKGHQKVAENVWEVMKPML